MIIIKKIFPSKILKKGAGDAISALILFIAVIGVSLGVIIAFQQFVTQSQDSLTTQQDLILKKVQTQLIISNVFYEPEQEEVVIFVRNVGKTTLDTNLLNFFINQEFKKNLETLNANTNSPIQVMDLQDTIRVVFPTQLSPGTHEVIIVTEFGNIIKRNFNVD
ncbi:MAG: hypothetical protein ACMXYB_01320 [Candidatus Woesearchaeota archaeon]